uniref:Uncharacterized protein n=1 Tax=viral metagenome TaxID=1070528 RepID=A0A6C0KPC7_9ZZZZ
MTFDFSHLCTIRPTRSMWKDPMDVDDRVHSVMQIVNRTANDEKRNLHIHLDYDNYELRTPLIAQQLGSQLSYYVQCRSICRDEFHRIRNYDTNDNITELYFYPEFQDKIEKEDLPSTLTTMYVHYDYKYKDKLSICTNCKIVYYHNYDTFHSRFYLNK